jgi:hypothetical protein
MHVFPCRSPSIGASHLPEGQFVAALGHLNPEAAVQPCGPPASSRSARYWSLLMRAHALIVTVRSQDFRAAAGAFGATRCRHNDYPNSAPNLIPRSARRKAPAQRKGKTGAPGKGRFPGEVWGRALGSIPHGEQLSNPATPLAASWRTPGQILPPECCHRCHVTSGVFGLTISAGKCGEGPGSMRPLL